MPLHLLGKKSWNVYNADNIARVKADEAAAAAREAADEQRTQELDAARRAAVLRGRTPPPLPDDDTGGKTTGRKQHGGHDRKRRKLAGEDDTDMDIRLARTTASDHGAEAAAKILTLRSTATDAPLTDHAGHIDLFPVDMKDATKRQKNADVNVQKRTKEKILADQYTMRFENAAGKSGLANPWYTTKVKPADSAREATEFSTYPGLESKDVWGNEDPRRKEREHTRITTSDPFALMQKAQAQLKRAKEEKKKWAAERHRELQELRVTQEREDRTSRHHKRKKRADDERGVDDDRAGRGLGVAFSATNYHHHQRNPNQRHEKLEHSSSRRTERGRDGLHRHRHQHSLSRQDREHRRPGEGITEEK